MGFSESVLQLCQCGTYDVVLPTCVSALEALIPCAEQLSTLAHTLLPSESQFRAGIDKIRTVSVCHEYGIDHPETIFLSNNSCLEDIVRELGLPLVLKHRRNFGGSLGVRIVAERDRLDLAVHELLKLSNDMQDLVVQQFLPGTLFDVCVVALRGKVAGLATQVRRLMLPVSGGVGAIVATVDMPDLAKKAEYVIEALNWNGPAQLEFKWDTTRGTWSLIEINPRPWGTFGAWLRAGANFPALVVDLALGRDIGAFISPPPNLRFSYVLGRTPLALIQLWRAKGFRALHDPWPYTHTWNDFELSDPLPDLLRLYGVVKTVIRGKRLLVDKALPSELIPSFTDSRVDTGPPNQGKSPHQY